ncbi:hypothetical protein [Streptomyces californicus]|uniref:hypothetical protein n=1 Tax=Streptomyces californicus TaxID=67351 RepID=UPI0037A16F3C
MTVSFPDVVRYIADAATLDDLALFSEAITTGRTRVAQERMDALVEGQEIRTDRFQDQQLNGLTGTIRSIGRVAKPTAVITVEGESLWLLQGHRKYGHRIPEGATSFALAVPLACVFPR